MKKKLIELAEGNFLQTDFSVLLRVNEGKMYLGEIISKTSYSRDTVNTVLRRLLDTGKIFRDQTETGKYVYSISSKLDVNNTQYMILDYLMLNYKKLMTPNVCRIMCVLLDDGRYSIQDLISNGWKPAALYKNTKRLLEKGIVVEDDRYFELSPVFKEEVINSDISKKFSIATYNFNDYKNTKDKKERIEKFKKLMDGKSIWAIQDFVVGQEKKWLEKLTGDNYKIILPNKYENSDYRSMIALLLIDKEVFQNYEELVLGEDKIFNLRYTYGRLTLKNGKIICILNLYMPQSYNVLEKRKLEIKEFWKIVIEEVRRCRIINEEFIVIGDLNAFDGEASENKDSFIRLDDIMIDVFEDRIKEQPEWRDTWISPDGKIKRRLDYIFVNSKVIFNNVIACNVDSSSLEHRISDHKILQLELKLLP